MSHLFRNNFSNVPSSFSTHAVPRVSDSSNKLYHHRVISTEQSGSPKYLQSSGSGAVRLSPVGSNKYRYQLSEPYELETESSFDQSGRAILIPVMHMEGSQNSSYIQRGTALSRTSPRAQPFLTAEDEVDDLTDKLLRSMETRPSPLGTQKQTSFYQIIAPAGGSSIQGVRNVSDKMPQTSLEVTKQERDIVSNLNENQNQTALTNTITPLTTSPTDLISTSTGSENSSPQKNCFRCHHPLLSEQSSEEHHLPQPGTSDHEIKLMGALAVQLHASCFKCYLCSTPLMTNAYYLSSDRLLCPTCVRDGAVESCVNCERPIGERIFRAQGRPYHQACFVCSACNSHLDKKLFTVDAQGRLLCVEDFNRRFAPRCAACSRPIVPKTANQETRRLIAEGKDYHMHCYQILLTDSLQRSYAGVTSY